MTKDFQFLKPGHLVDGDLRLVLVKKHPPDPHKKHSPCYQFDMRKTGSKTKVGRITLRVDSATAVRYPGHIGYRVLKRYRGNRYAARACRLLFRFPHAHGLKTIWINCDPQNKASIRTLELVGGTYVETVRIPKTHEMYGQGERYQRRYRIGIGKELSNKAIDGGKK